MKIYCNLNYLPVTDFASSVGAGVSRAKNGVSKLTEPVVANVIVVLIGSLLSAFVSSAVVSFSVTIALAIFVVVLVSIVDSPFLNLSVVIVEFEFTVGSGVVIIGIIVSRSVDSATNN